MSKNATNAPAAATGVPTLNMNGKTYPIAELSEAARAQLQNLQIAEAEITRLKNQMGLAETARATFAAALKAELSKKG